MSLWASTSEGPEFASGYPWVLQEKHKAPDVERVKIYLSLQTHGFSHGYWDKMLSEDLFWHVMCDRSSGSVMMMTYVCAFVFLHRQVWESPEGERCHRLGRRQFTEPLQMIVSLETQMCGVKGWKIKLQKNAWGNRQRDMSAHFLSGL